MTSPAVISVAPKATLTWIVGLGGQCGDDYAGWRVIERLRELLGQRRDVQLLVAATPADLLHISKDCTRLIIIDACTGLGAPGHALCRCWPAAEIGQTRCGVGHNVSLSQALEIAAILGQLPAGCEVWCVEGRQFALAEPLSAEVAAACERVAGQISAELLLG